MLFIFLLPKMLPRRHLRITRYQRLVHNIHRFHVPIHAIVQTRLLRRIQVLTPLPRANFEAIFRDFAHQVLHHLRLDLRPDAVQILSRVVLASHVVKNAGARARS